MLSLSRYLLGVAELALLAGFAGLGAVAVRRRLLPGFSGPPAWLAAGVVALALLLWVAELLGLFGAFTALPYVLSVVALGSGIWALLPRVTPGDRTRGPSAVTLVALAIAAVAVIHFAAGVRLRLSTGMTGFDSTWYHGPLAAGFFQSGNTFDLHFIAPQFLAWFYPANSEVFHAIGMVAFHRDLLSLSLNVGWFVGCLLAAWCIGRPYKVAPLSLALGAIALSVPALADQAGEARNDIVGIFFLLAAVAVAVNAWQLRPGKGLSTGALAVVGLAAGLAAGTKLNFLLPAATLVIGLTAIAPHGKRWRSLAATGLGALAGSGYWYLRNLVHTGNPFPWVRHLGPISLPAPEQALGGREGHSVLGYMTDGSIWSDWLLPGLHHGFGAFWPLLVALALVGLLGCFTRGAGPLLRTIGATGLAVIAAWLIAPTSASGPTGMPRGFESGLRYLAPALVLGLTLLPISPSNGRILKAPSQLARRLSGRGVLLVCVSIAVLAVAFGYLEQRKYLQHRYASPSFSAPGLDAAFKWANFVSGAKIATTSTRQYPLFGRDLSNRVQYVGMQTPHGGFIPPATCPQWRRLINAGHYDYVVATRDRTEAGKAAYPPTARWTEGPGAVIVLRKPPTVVYKLRKPLDPSACR
jgi:hypothetical protein